MSGACRLAAEALLVAAAPVLLRLEARLRNDGRDTVAVAVARGGG